ncbi:hypothetical protein GGI12_002558 [Dipsacomyces acuminosporus]|nr:hypothetical protein GGI12_002558 [Dipsacomyces acuminosporus]
MITPRFSVRQDDTSVYVTVHAPHVRAQTIEFDVDEYQFKFFASPYYLRLTFPGKVIEDEQSTASFDAAAGDILVTLTKENAGEEFENLDLLTALLATRKEKEASSGIGTDGSAKRPIIQEIGGGGSSSYGNEGLDMDRSAILEDEEFDWEIPQTLVTEDSESLLPGSAKYGFDQQYNGFFTHVHETANEINEVPDPEHMSVHGRSENRIEREDAKFDEDYYMDNYVNDEDIVPLIQHKSRFYSILRRQQKQARKNESTADTTAATSDTQVDKLAQSVKDNLHTDETKSQEESWAEFTEEEKKAMLDLPRKTHLITNEQAVYLGLIDILFAYSLDCRINKGEPTVESVWSIGTLSPTLSNLEHFSSLRSVIVACFRRALAYPLYRNWDLCEKALEDVYVVLKLGRRAVLKVMLETKLMFDQHDVYYVYSKVFLDDYCVWLQTAASDKVIRSLAHKLHHFEVEKEEIGWHLDEFEDLALESSDSEVDNDDDVEEEAIEEKSNISAEDSADKQKVNKQPTTNPPQDKQKQGKRLIQVIGEEDVGEPDEFDAPSGSHSAGPAARNSIFGSHGSVDQPSTSSIILPTPTSPAPKDDGNGTPASAKKPLIEIIE